MKKLIFFFLLLPFALFSQKTRKVVEQQKNDGWDIVIPIEERTPKNETSLKRATAATLTNWGKEYLLPEKVRARLASECKHPVAVKVLDTGNPTHPFLTTGKQAPTVYTGEPSATDGQGHSTHVCGIMFADQIGILDVLVNGGVVTYYAVKVLQNSGTGSWNWLQTALEGEAQKDKALFQKGVSVVYNGSMGGATFIPSINSALERYEKEGGVYLFASGNTGREGVNFPASSPYVIACGSIEKNLKPSSFSTFGPQVNNAMPGGAIYSTYISNGFAELSGTSMATPFLTAAAVVALSKWGGVLRGPGNMKKYLAWCATDLHTPGKDNYTGYGAALIESVLDKNPADMPGDITQPPKVKREFVFAFGPYPFKWIENKKPDMVTHTATLTALEVVTQSEKTAVEHYTAIQSALQTLYMGRNIIMGKGQDVWDAFLSESGAVVLELKKLGIEANVKRALFEGDGVKAVFE